MILVEQNLPLTEACQHFRCWHSGFVSHISKTSSIKQHHLDCLHLDMVANGAVFEDAVNHIHDTEDIELDIMLVIVDHGSINYHQHLNCVLIGLRWPANPILSHWSLLSCIICNYIDKRSMKSHKSFPYFDIDLNVKLRVSSKCRNHHHEQYKTWFLEW